MSLYDDEFREAIRAGNNPHEANRLALIAVDQAARKLVRELSISVAEARDMLNAGRSPERVRVDVRAAIARGGR